jgi:hypothetical protein
MIPIKRKLLTAQSPEGRFESLASFDSEPPPAVFMYGDKSKVSGNCTSVVIFLHTSPPRFEKLRAANLFK